MRWCSNRDHPDCLWPSGMQMATVRLSGRYSDSHINLSLGLNSRYAWNVVFGMTAPPRFCDGLRGTASSRP